jgi:hypothetical protein
MDDEDLSIALADIEVARLVPDWSEYLRAGSA